MHKKNSRREFLELLTIGGAAFLAPYGCSCGKDEAKPEDIPLSDLNQPMTRINVPALSEEELEQMAHQKRRMQRHDYNLPTLREINNANIAYLILDLERRFGKNGAIPSMRRFSNYRHAKNKLGEHYVSIERFRYSNECLQQLTDVDAWGILENIRDNFPSIYNANGEFNLCDSLLSDKFGSKSYSFLVLGFAELAGLPLYGVRTPDHMFTRWDSRHIHINLDQGKIRFDPAQSIGSGRHRINIDSIRGSNFYLKSLGRQEMVGDYLGVIANNLANNEEFTAALDLINLAEEWTPESPSVMAVKNNILNGLGY